MSVKSAMRKLRQAKAERDVAAEQVNSSIRDYESALRGEGVRIEASIPLGQSKDEQGRVFCEEFLAWSRHKGTWRLVLFIESASGSDETLLVDAPLKARTVAVQSLPDLLEKLVCAVKDQTKELLGSSTLVDEATIAILELDDEGG